MPYGRVLFYNLYDLYKLCIYVLKFLMAWRIIGFYIVVISTYDIKTKRIFFILYMFSYYNMKTYYVIADWSFL